MICAPDIYGSDKSFHQLYPKKIKHTFHFQNSFSVKLTVFQVIKQKRKKALELLSFLYVF
jgi:hypothetical protein